VPEHARLSIGQIWEVAECDAADEMADGMARSLAAFFLSARVVSACFDCRHVRILVLKMTPRLRDMAMSVRGLQWWRRHDGLEVGW
jgi:hypothetical protein